MQNLDEHTVRGFGDEWTRFDQSALSASEKQDIFNTYFRGFPFSERTVEWEGFDAGCGSGRWASLIAPRVKRLHLVDASMDALAVAKRALSAEDNCEFHHCAVDQMPLPDGSMDFGYSLGVLHHVPDPAAALAACTKKLKPGAPLLVYVYYAFDHRPWWFRALWRASNTVRRVVARMPPWLRHQFCAIVAGAVYWPLARAARLANRAGYDISNWPLSFYATRSFYVMRTDARDRFGTRLEQRFTRAQLHQMMVDGGLERIRFSDTAPFWCAVGFRTTNHVESQRGL
jgi:SAM-dependent methyltransferase